MTKKIFITATNTDIGKTYTTKLLLRQYAKLGHRVGVIKPIETGVIQEPADASALYELTCILNPEFKNLTLEDIVPITYKLPAAPYIASRKMPLDLGQIDDAIRKISNYCDVLLIEGAGGLLVPIDEKHSMIDLALHLKAHVLLVTHCSLGCINDTLLSKQLLERYNMPHHIVFNCKEEDEEGFETVSKPYFEDIFEDIFLLNKDITRLSEKLLV